LFVAALPQVFCLLRHCRNILSGGKDSEKNGAGKNGVILFCPFCPFSVNASEFRVYAVAKRLKTRKKTKLKTWNETWKEA
jgi:hypothetical protein